MGNALRDQLLKSGLVNDKQLKKATKEKQKEERRQHGQKQLEPDTSELQAQRIAAEKAAKAERDRVLNQQRKDAADQKALLAQIQQLIDSHRQTPGDGDIPYNFADEGKIKRIYVDSDVRDRIAAGRLVIVKAVSAYELVAPDVAQRLRERHPGSIVLWNDSAATMAHAELDPYAQYQVPDDLTW